MKKIISSLVAMTAILSAATNEQILKLYQNPHLPKDIKIEIVDRVPLDKAPGFEAVTIKMSQGEMSQESVLFTNGDFLLFDLVDVNSGESLKSAFEQKLVKSSVAKIYKNEDPKNIIKLGSDNKKATVVIFTDTNCPYCRHEMDMIDERLKDTNVEIIMASIHGDAGHKKSAAIYKEIAKAKDDKAKIAILKKYYDKNFDDSTLKIEESETQAAKALAEKYFMAGINAVPFIVDKSELK